MEFEDIDWHDQILRGIKIDRENPGNNDSIELEFILNGKKTTIIFYDVYHAEFNMNFGIISQESLSYGSMTKDGTDIEAIQDKWNSAGAKIDSLTCFEFNTNSTNSLIKIYSLSCVIMPFF